MLKYEKDKIYMLNLNNKKKEFKFKYNLIDSFCQFFSVGYHCDTKFYFM